MIKPRDPKTLAVDLLPRSPCSIKVAAVFCTASGEIHSWGWNHVGSGFGKHAEVHAIERANHSRVWYGTIYVAGKYNRGTLVKAKPCKDCQALIDKYHIDVVYRAKDGSWVEL